MRHRYLLLSGTFFIAYACGGTDRTSTTTSSTGMDTSSSDTSSSSGSSGMGGTGGNGTAGDGGGSIFSCPSNLLCGAAATCCNVGDDCVDGACVAACPGAVHCNGACCTAGQICLSDACVTPGIPCTDSVDCSTTEFCEPTLGQCLPQPPGGPSCEYRPMNVPFMPVLEWSWTGSPIQPNHDQVLSVPLVGDVDGDSIPEVAVVTHDRGDGGCDSGWGYLRLLDGKTGAEKWDANVEAYSDAGRIAFCRNPALADLDGDGDSEIIAHRFGGGLIAFDAKGAIVWSSKLSSGNGQTPYNGYFGWSSAVIVANMDNTGDPEVISGGVILNSKGKVIAGIGREGIGSNGSAGYGGNSLVADVDGDNIQEILTGSAAYNFDGTVKWQNGMLDGYTALADFDGDNKPELVVIASGSARVHDAATGVLLAQAPIPGGGAGGPPTISDFDGDGDRDFASAVGTSYTIFTFNKLPSPAVSVLWSVPTADGSSARTGSSIFDFEGDGISEVLYNDECYLRVYGGKMGNVLVEIASSSATANQYPVAVDVDGDNHTELVVVSDDKYQLANQTPGCPNYKPGEVLRHGVFVYGDTSNKWVRTRRIWNEHSYHVTNIGADGKVPLIETPSFSANNTYRVSEPGNGTFNAPDLRVDLSAGLAGCPDNIDLRATVRNDGSLGVGPGVTVEIFEGKDATGQLLGTAKTSKALLPGETEVVSISVPLAGKTPPYAFYARVDEVSPGKISECQEMNNDSFIDNVICPELK